MQGRCPEEIKRISRMVRRLALEKMVGIVQHRKREVKSTYLTLDTFSWFIVERIVSSPLFFLLGVGKYTVTFVFFLNIISLRKTYNHEAGMNHCWMKWFSTAIVINSSLSFSSFFPSFLSPFFFLPFFLPPFFLYSFPSFFFLSLSLPLSVSFSISCFLYFFLLL